LLAEAHHRIQIVRIPFRRNFAKTFVEHAPRSSVSRCAPARIKRRPPDDTFVNAVARVQPSQRGIRKVPLPRVEAENLINHDGFVRGLLRAVIGLPPSAAIKQRLPPVRVATAIYRRRACRQSHLDFLRRGNNSSGRKSSMVTFVGIARVTRTELQSRCTGHACPRHFHAQFRRQPDQSPDTSPTATGVVGKPTTCRQPCGPAVR